MTSSSVNRQVLIVEDDAATRDALALLVGRRGHRVFTADTLAQARATLEQHPDLDFVLTDLGLPDGDGLSLLAPEAGLTARHAFVVLTGERRIERAVEAMRLGAIDFLNKPVEPDTLALTLTRVERHLDDQDAQRELRRELARHGAFEGLVGRTDAMQAVYALVERVARSRLPVFVLGESGTGKELLARAIHRVSQRRARPFVAINCGAIPDALVESELFGHERGAFTGATTRRAGVFEQADQGTLFLDELPEMPPEHQVSLLRVLEEGRVRPVGSARELPVDVRVVSATNRDPEQAVREGRLREDLFFRLHVFPITLPPLRDRKDDIPLLAAHFVRQVAQSEGGPELPLTDAAMDALRAHTWPGNLRELRNVIARAWLLAPHDTGGSIDRPHLPPAIAQLASPGAARVAPAAAPAPAAATAVAPDTDDAIRVPIGTTLADAERALVEATLARFHGHRERTAQALGITPKTLYNKCRAWGLQPPRNVRS